MRKNIFAVITALIIMICTAQTAVAKSFLDSLEYDVRVGYTIGGTMPMNIPSTVRKLNKYTIKLCGEIAVDVHADLGKRWGIMTGVAFEKKAMAIEATVKNYHMTIIRGGEELTGNFTGRNNSNVSFWMFTIPLLATYDVSRSVRLKLGPYASILTAKTFDGCAHDGYLRVDDPTGAKIEVGNTDSTRGVYDFSDDLRRVQYGIRAGADWQFYHSWGAFADISWGLHDIFSSGFHTVQMTLYPVYGTIGIVYKLN